MSHRHKLTEVCPGPSPPLLLPSVRPQCCQTPQPPTPLARPLGPSRILQQVTGLLQPVLPLRGGHSEPPSVPGRTFSHMHWACSLLHWRGFQRWALPAEDWMLSRCLWVTCPPLGLPGTTGLSCPVSLEGQSAINTWRSTQMLSQPRLQLQQAVRCTGTGL